MNHADTFLNPITGEREILSIPTWEVFPSPEDFPREGKSLGLLYLAQDTNLLYRWSGSAYVQVGGSGGGSSFDPSTQPDFSQGLKLGGTALQNDSDNLLWNGQPVVPSPLSEIAALTPADGDVLTRAVGAWVSAPPSGGGGSSSFILMNDSNLDSGWFTGVANEKPYAVDTTSGPAFCQLPASPTVGDTIEFTDAKGTWNTHGFTISRNGKKIEGLDVDYLDTAQGTQFFIIYIDDTTGWKIYESGTKSHILEVPTTPTGSASTGSILTADNGTWTGSPTSYSYQWKNSPDGTTWTDISGAASSTYTLQSGDATLYVACEVIAANSNGNSLPSLSAATTAITLSSLLTSLLAFYGMADLTDASGNGNDLTDTGGTDLTTQGGINGALFDGSGGTCLANPTLALGPVWSFSYWVYVVSDTSDNEYPCMGRIGTAGGTQLVMVGGDFNASNNWLYDQFTGQNYGQNQVVSEGAWHHHVIIGDSTNGLRWFIDGTEISIGSPIYDLTKTGFMLGQYNEPAQAFNGLIGPTSIWNRALTSGEVTALYNAGSPLPFSSYATTA